MNIEKTDNNIPLETQEKKTQFQADLHQIKTENWIHVTSARLLFKSDLRCFVVLALSEKRIKPLAGWTRQAKKFYHTALKEDEIIRKFNENGIPKEDLERCLAKLKTLERNKLWRKYTHEEWAKGEYELQKMYDDIKKTFYNDSGKVRDALKDEPEKIVQLGLEKSVEDVLERQEKDKRRKWKKKKKLKEEEEK